MVNVNQPTPVYRFQATLNRDGTITVHQASNPQLMNATVRKFVADKLKQAGDQMKRNIFSDNSGEYHEPCPS